MYKYNNIARGNLVQLKICMSVITYSWRDSRPLMLHREITDKLAGSEGGGGMQCIILATVSDVASGLGQYFLLWGEGEYCQ